MVHLGKTLRKVMRGATCILALFALTSLAPAALGAGKNEKSEAEKRAEAIDGDIRLKSQNAVHFIPFGGTTSAVTSVKTKIKVDGDLGDWRANGVKPIMLAGPGHVTWNGEYGSEKNMSSAMYLGADDECFYIGMEIKDDKDPAPSRIEVAFADADRKVIVGWVDVGYMYGHDDVHLVFDIDASGGIRTRFIKRQNRLNESMINNAFGTEDERRAFVESGPADAQTGKIFSIAKRQKAGDGSVTYFEAAFPWRMLTPIVPTEYKPFKFNAVVHDNDGDTGGVVGWAPGLAGAYSGFHFPVLTFAPRADRKDIAAFAMLPQFEFVNEDIKPSFTFYNNGPEVKGVLELFDRAAPDVALSTNAVTLPNGMTKTDIAVFSEKIGKRSVALGGRLVVNGKTVKEVAVSAPSYGDTLSIQPVAELEAAIARLVDQTHVLSNLCLQVKAKGLDSAYPEAMFALHELFIGRCKGDLRPHPRLVIENTNYLNDLFAQHKAYIESILKDPSKQLKMPPRFKPDELTFKDGFYNHKGRPVWLWGPCTFWFMRSSLPYSWRLGANSIGPEFPIHNASQAAAITNYLNDCYTNGVLVNAAIGESGMEDLKKQYPEIANVDPNNFLSFLIQHPIARAEIVKRIQDGIAFFSKFPGVRSYWLWNEPDYRNFSEMTRRDFIDQFAKKKYVYIDQLNKRWGTNYKSFEDIQLPRKLDWESGNHAPWVDFQMFMQDMHADFFGFLNKTAKAFDPTRPTHTKFMCISAAFFDIERLQGFYDIGGHDGNAGERDLVFLDLVRSIYPDHPLVNTEIHIWYRDWSTVAIVPWRLALHGLADGNWWCWHPNHRFSNTTGSAQSMRALSFSGMDVQRLFDPYIFALNQKERKIATLYQDIVADRSWGLLDKIRYQIAPPQYSLGIQPHYATEKAIARGELSKFKLLIAPEASYVKDSTYQGVLDYVTAGGTAIILTNSFTRNEYNDVRDTSALMPAWGWEQYVTNGVYTKSVGKGRVICIEPPTDDEGKIDGKALTAYYAAVFDQAMTDLDLHDPIRLVLKDVEKPTVLQGLDVRFTKVDGAYVLCALGGTYNPDEEGPAVRLDTKLKIKKIVDLINNVEIPVDQFKLAPVANLFRIEAE